MQKEEGLAISPPLVSNPRSELNPNKGPQYNQILTSCGSLVQLWLDKIIGDLYRGRAETATLGDGSGQSDTSEELLLSTRQFSSTLLVVLATHERRCSQGPVEIPAQMVSRVVSRITTWMPSGPMEAKGILIGIWRDRRRLGFLQFGGLQ